MGTLPSAIERLSATGPYAPDRDHLMAGYGRLVGDWVIDWVRLGGNGEALERRRGEWRFAWVLGGRGVQDVIWTAGAPREDDGTTLRVWDAQLGAWRVVFMSPGDGQFVTLLGRADGDRIVQEMIDPVPEGHRKQWTFSEITDDGFLWQALTSTDEGRTWTVSHEMRASRPDDQGEESA